MKEKMVVRRFEDLVAWQKARGLTREIYRVTSDGAFIRDFRLRDQTRRACTSVMSNFASLLAQAEEVGRILGGLRVSVQKQRDKD